MKLTQVDGHINSFKDLMDHISWNWDYPTYELKRDKDGSFYLNKLYIRRYCVSYKEYNYSLAPHIFDEVIRFYEFLQSTNDMSTIEKEEDMLND